MFPKEYSLRLSRLLKSATNFRLSWQKSRKSQKSTTVPKLTEGAFKVLDSPAHRIPQSEGPSIYDLPDELIIAILDCCPQTSLAAVARTSRYLYSIATPILYEDILLQHPHRAVLLFRTLIENPDLAAFVRSFRRANRTTSCRCSQAFARSLGSTPPDLQATALKNAKQLQVIEMRMGPAAAQFPQAMDRVRYLLDDKDIKLRKMVIHPLSRSFTDTIWWNQYIVAILRAQPSLEELDISSLSWGHVGGGGSNPLTQEDLPNLRRVVSASAATFKTISPATFPSISYVGFRHMSPEEISEALPLLGSNIRSLEIVTPLATLMNYFATPAFDQLRFLRLRVYIADGVDLAIADPFFAYLGSLHHLEELDLGQSPYSPLWTSHIRKWRRPDEATEECQSELPEERALPIYQELLPRLLRLSLPGGFSWHRTAEESSWIRLPESSSTLGFEQDVPLHELGFPSCSR
ncbi:hypothetical protein FRC04_008549 [Tulasnella sp. 424]|nr:hypothetical protein FRC04_008549 [Tulasnella sp. 424]KAG8974019.1 hypothetical protein FRC05_007935 [Tulasnella sp. 425]